MNTKFILKLAVSSFVALMVSGCEDKASATRAACVNIDKVTDIQQKAELLKRCPRVGPKFQPSPKVYW